MLYRQINKKTGIEYPPVSKEAKESFEYTPSTNVFKFIPIPEPKKATAPEGVKTMSPSKPPKRRKAKTNTVQDDNTERGHSRQAVRKKT